MTDSSKPDPRIEIVARAMAKHRLGHSQFAVGLPSDAARSILERSVDRLWPSLVEEAGAVVAALDSPHELPEPAPSPPAVPGQPPVPPTEQSVGLDDSGKPAPPRGLYGHFEGL